MPICRKFCGGFFALGGLHHPPGRGGGAGPAWPCFERDRILRSDFSDFRSEIAKSRLRCIPPKTKNPALRPQVYILDYPVLRTKTPAHIRGSRKAKAFPAAAAALRRTSSTPARRVPATLLRRAASSAPAPPPAASGVDLDGYPIHRPDSAAYRVLVDASRGALAATGCAFFPGFLTPQATHRAAEEARAAAPRAFVTDDTHNAYQLPGTDPNLPDNHPRNVPMRTRVASTAYDELAGSQLHALYNLNFDPFVQFGGSGIESQVYKYHKECILLSRLPGRGGAHPPGGADRPP